MHHMRKGLQEFRYFNDLGGLKYHKMNVHNVGEEDNKYKCVECSKQYTSLGGLKYHMAKVHNQHDLKKKRKTQK